MTKLLLTALIGLSTGALLHTSPRQLADTAEHALGWVCRMTYNMNDEPASFESVYPAESRWLMRTYRTHGPYFWPFHVSISGRVTILRMFGLPRLRATPVELRP